ncbi:hypothetical protein BBOV_I004660 [Babesia bovis T2Bo]|uniref:hypothetical protein n=1 Tax=Babesia bovis T2Bo TaxID=484906 RepID=UPI001C34DD0C|nr:hypothetical protein BBOV_I004660 [Babesia bovis T2Bo]EDO05547.2 hypothetical protein BBOV_I004660 [Babesia bovis T2Bo]
MAKPDESNNDKYSESDGYIFSFPAYRSSEWLERHRLMPAVQGCLKGVTLQPRSLLYYSHVKAYEIKAEKVRSEIRNALFRQALFKIQNIEVVASSKCNEDRKLIDIIPKSAGWSIKKKNTIVADEIWRIDRCGSVQQYNVRYYREGDDGFTCRVFPMRVGNLLNYVRYYLSI